MSVTRAVSGVVVVVGCVAVVSASAATPAKKAPRIVAAVMQDADRDGQADAVALTYSARIRHARDRDGRYPLVVKGYRIRFVGAASGRTLALALVERGQPDTLARPAIRYRRTRLQPVTGLDADRGRGAALSARRVPTGTSRAPNRRRSPPASTPAPAARAADATATATATARSTRKTARRGTRPFIRERPICRISASSTRTATGSTGRRRTRSSSRRLGNDTDPGTRGEADAADRRRPSRPRRANASTSSPRREAYGRVEAATRVDLYGGYDGANWSRSRS